MDDDTSFALVVALSAALAIALLIVAVLAGAVLRRRRVSADGEGAAAEEEEEEKEGEVRRCSWEEIERLTGNFTAEVVGVGGFSTVYRAINGGGGGAAEAAEAVVKVQRSGGGERRRAAFALELELLRRLRHPNIVRLLAYCDDREEEGALVLEYAPNGTLHDRLHSPAASAAPLPWAARTQILYDVAGALAHLHSASASASASASGAAVVVVVHGDVTSSNVLLGPLPRLRPLLCDFGSARLGFSASLSPSLCHSVAVASPGYADPFFLRTGILSKSSDVYAFGVLLLETLTGRPAVASDGRNLTADIAPPIAEGLLDPRLRGPLGLGFDAAAEAEAAAAAEIAARCVGAQPSLRPSMAEVRALIRERMPSAISAADPGSDGPDDRQKKMAEP